MHVQAKSSAPSGSLSALFVAQDDRRDVHRRAHLHRAGDMLHHGYLVAAGWFGRFRTGPSGTEAVTAVYLPGDIIGLDTVFGGRSRDEVTALSNGTVLRMPLDALRDAIGRGGQPALDAVRLVGEDAGFVRETLFAVGTQSSFERLSAFILQTYDRLVQAAQLSAGADRFALPLTQAQLGAVTGLTSVHVNRVLKQLRLAGLLEIRGGSVRVLDLNGLRRAAQRRPDPHHAAPVLGQAFV